MVSLSTRGGLGGTSGSIVTLIGTSYIESVYVPGVFSLTSLKIFEKSPFFPLFSFPPVQIYLEISYFYSPKQVYPVNICLLSFFIEHLPQFQRRTEIQPFFVSFLPSFEKFLNFCDLTYRTSLFPVFRFGGEGGQRGARGPGGVGLYNNGG